jgi:hypothetical protein
MTASQQPWALQDLAQQFAEEWDDLLKAVFPAAPDFDVETRGSKFVVHPTGRVVPLFVQQERLASLEVTASCVWDSESRYLAVERSQFTLAADLDRTPILRFDYVRNMNVRPHSHIQVHGHRGAMSHLLSRAAHPTPHDLASLHLPTGGSRFRPCLEDVVQFLIEECRFDCVSGWKAHIEAGRERWRRKQVAAAVRAVPSEAARVLSELGYAVTMPITPVADSTAALTRW